jgi:hypothetical protein
MGVVHDIPASSGCGQQGRHAVEVTLVGLTVDHDGNGQYGTEE